jgi:hypothetical protein
MALKPIAVLRLLALFDFNAENPLAVLVDPVVFDDKAILPMAVF